MNKCPSKQEIITFYNSVVRPILLWEMSEGENEDLRDTVLSGLIGTVLCCRLTHSDVAAICLEMMDYMVSCLEES